MSRERHQEQALNKNVHKVVVTVRSNLSREFTICSHTANIQFDHSALNCFKCNSKVIHFGWITWRIHSDFFMTYNMNFKPHNFTLTLEFGLHFSLLSTFVLTRDVSWLETWVKIGTWDLTWVSTLLCPSEKQGKKHCREDVLLSSIYQIIIPL